MNHSIRSQSRLHTLVPKNICSLILIVSFLFLGGSISGIDLAIASEKNSLEKNDSATPKKRWSSDWQVSTNTPYNSAQRCYALVPSITSAETSAENSTEYRLLQLVEALKMNHMEPDHFKLVFANQIKATQEFIEHEASTNKLVDSQARVSIVNQLIARQKRHAVSLEQLLETSKNLMTLSASENLGHSNKKTDDQRDYYIKQARKLNQDLDTSKNELREILALAQTQKEKDHAALESVKNAISKIEIEIRTLNDLEKKLRALQTTEMQVQIRELIFTIQNEVHTLATTKSLLRSNVDALDLFLSQVDEPLESANRILNIPRAEVLESFYARPQRFSDTGIWDKLNFVFKKLLNPKSEPLPKGIRNLSPKELRTKIAIGSRIYFYEHLGSAFQEENFDLVKGIQGNNYSTSKHSSFNWMHAALAETNYAWKGFYVGQRIEFSREEAGRYLTVLGFLPTDGSIIVKVSTENSAAIIERFSPEELGEIQKNGELKKRYGSDWQEAIKNVAPKNRAKGLSEIKDRMSRPGADLFLLNSSQPLWLNENELSNQMKISLGVVNNSGGTTKFMTDLGSHGTSNVALRDSGFVWMGLRVGDKFYTSITGTIEYEIMGITLSGSFVVAERNLNLPGFAVKVEVLSESLAIHHPNRTPPANVEPPPSIPFSRRSLSLVDLSWRYSIGQKAMVVLSPQQNEDPSRQTARRKNLVATRQMVTGRGRYDQKLEVENETLSEDKILLFSEVGLTWIEHTVGAIYKIVHSGRQEIIAVQIIGFDSDGDIYVAKLEPSHQSPNEETNNNTIERQQLFTNNGKPVVKYQLNEVYENVFTFETDTLREAVRRASYGF